MKFYLSEIAQQFNDQPDFGRKAEYKYPPSGDLWNFDLQHKFNKEEKILLNYTKNADGSYNCLLMKYPNNGIKTYF